MKNVKNPFAVVASMLVAGCLLVSCEKEMLEAEPIQTSASEDARGSTVVRNPLYFPAEVSPAGLLLTAAPGAVNLGDGKNTTVWAYNGSFPGPTLRANRGDRSTITFQNNLPAHSIIHWHGW